MWTNLTHEKPNQRKKPMVPNRLIKIKTTRPWFTYLENNNVVDGMTKIFIVAMLENRVRTAELMQTTRNGANGE